MHATTEIKYSFWHVLVYLGLCLKGLFKSILYVGFIPTLPVKQAHSAATLKISHQVAARVNFMARAMRIGLHEESANLLEMQIKLRRIFAFREGFVPFVSWRDYEMMLLIEQPKLSAYELYFILSLWDENTIYPKWADLPPEMRNDLSRSFTNIFVNYE